MNVSSKVLLITNMIPPYRVPLFELLDQGVEQFSVLTVSKIERNRSWDQSGEYTFDTTICEPRSITIVPGHAELHLSFIWKHLRNINPDVIITSGYDQIGYWQGLLYAKLFKKKFILWNGTTLLSEEKKFTLSQPLKRLFIRSADRYITYGSKATEYLISYGAKKEDIVTGYNTVDTKRFENQVKAFRDSNAYYTFRASYAEANERIFLYVGRLISYKGMSLVLQSIDPSIPCIIVGDGPEKKELEEIVASRGLTKVVFAGHVAYDELYKFYAIADIFIFPTQLEPWGLVVNEALAAGLPVLTTRHCGAGYDLIRDGKNGEIVDFTKEHIVEQKLLHWYTDILPKRDDVQKTLQEKKIPDYKDAFMASIQSHEL